MPIPARQAGRAIPPAAMARISSCMPTGRSRWSHTRQSPSSTAAPGVKACPAASGKPSGGSSHAPGSSSHDARPSREAGIPFPRRPEGWAKDAVRAPPPPPGSQCPVFPERPQWPEIIGRCSGRCMPMNGLARESERGQGEREGFRLELRASSARCPVRPRCRGATSGRRGAPAAGTRKMPVPPARSPRSSRCGPCDSGGSGTIVVHRRPHPRRQHCPPRDRKGGWRRDRAGGSPGRWGAYPKYACCTSGFSASSSGVPAATTRPLDST